MCIDVHIPYIYIFILLIYTSIMIKPPILRSDNYLIIAKLSGVIWTSPEFLRKPTRVSPTGGKTNFRCRASMYKPPCHCPWFKLKG